jgi:hypothetical protein
VDISSEFTVFSKQNFEINSRGRPFGGTGWIIDKELKIIHQEFINDRLSYITIEHKNIKWIVIGVYMPFDNNKIDSFSEYETNLSIISELIITYKRMGNYNIVIGGDFNADLKRNKKFDKCLLKFVKKEKLVIPIFENVNQSKVDYTYFVNNYNACLDHIFVFNTNEFINNNLSKIKSMINEDTINTSDHHSVSIEIFFKELNLNETESFVNLENKKKKEESKFIKIYPDLDNTEIKDIFVNKVEILLREKMSSNSDTNIDGMIVS